MATTATRKTSSTRSAPARKTPTDRKPPAPKVKETDTGREVTIDGLTVTIENAAVDDFELMDLMGRADREQNPTLLPELLRRFVGEDGYRAVMDHLRKDGRVPLQDAITFVNRLIGALNPNS